MKASLHAIRLDAYRQRMAPLIRGGGPGGVWTLDGQGGGATLRGPGDGGRAVLLVPSERVLVLAVDLPLPTRARRLAALPFAIEDRIAESIETVHVALGAAAGPGRWLAGVAAPAAMAEWVGRAEAAGLGQAALVPDALALPVPEDGAWNVARTGARVLVRAADGTGFALASGSFAAVWTAAGRPRCMLHGEPLPDGIAGVMADPVASAVPPAIDLRQGRFARAGRRPDALWRRAAVVAACGLAAHAAIAVADVAALQRAAAARRAETAAIVAQVAPDVPTDGDLASTAADLLPAVGPAGQARFVPAMARLSGALGSGTALRSIAYDAAAGTLVVDMAAPDPDAVRAAEARLRAAGLAAVEMDAAAGRIIVRTGRAG